MSIRKTGNVLWQDGVVPFAFEDAVPENSRTQITNAMNHIQSRTNIIFCQRNGQNDFIRFQFNNDVGACSSPVGRVGGSQPVFCNGGFNEGITIHEILHALGLWHEQSREDRDAHIKINFENITRDNLNTPAVNEDRRHNFNQHTNDGEGIGAYDYNSIMHYGTNDFSANDLPTIEVLSPPAPVGTVIGQRNGLSTGDISALNCIYPGYRGLRTEVVSEKNGNTGKYIVTAFDPCGNQLEGDIVKSDSLIARTGQEFTLQLSCKRKRVWVPEPDRKPPGYWETYWVCAPIREPVFLRINNFRPKLLNLTIVAYE